jgi:hypothetical protein
MRVLVCGGRDYTDRNAVYRVLDRLHKKHTIAAIIQGGARGADRLAVDWATSRKIVLEWYIADWNRLGPGAGHIRNQRMIDEGKPDAVVAFPGGTGTADMA